MTLSLSSTSTTTFPLAQDGRKEEWERLCRVVEIRVPRRLDALRSEQLEGQGDAWVLIIASALITSPSPQLLAEFSSFLTQNHPQFQTEDARTKLSLRLRDVCLKLIVIVGAPAVLCALMPLAEAEGDVERKARESVLSEKWKNIDVTTTHSRGVSTILSIYDQKFLPGIFAQWGSHKEDVSYNILLSVYGMYLSDFEVLTPPQTEAVVFTSITCQGFKGPGLWHLRGMGRMLGARGEERQSTKNSSANSSDENPQNKNEDEESELDTRKNAEQETETDQAKSGIEDKIDNTNAEQENITRVKSQLQNLKAAIREVVEFVGLDYVTRAKVDDWADVEDVQNKLGGWGQD